MIRIENLSQVFSDTSGNPVQAIKNVSVHIRPGEIFGIIGRSGAGKSTLVRTINFLTRPTSGTVTVNNQCLNDLSQDQLRQVRTKIGMIFQHFNLLSSRTVFENIALPLELIGVPHDQIQKKVNELIHLVDLDKHRDKYPKQLSGGQKQRVGIARALANDPTVLLSDESTSALDPENTRSVLALLQQINKKLGVTIVLITHEMDVVKQICDRVVVMDSGEVVESGQVIDIFRHPQHPTTHALLADVLVHDMPDSIKKTVQTRVQGALKANRVARLLRLTFLGSEVTEPVLSEIARRYQVDFNILQAQVEELKGVSFGVLVILAECATEKDLKTACDYAAQFGIDIEEI